MRQLIRRLWREPASRFIGHWRGELSLKLVFTYCPKLVFSVLMFYTCVVLAAVIAGYRFSTYRFNWTAPLFFFLVITFALWWSIGTIRTAKRIFDLKKTVTSFALILVSLPIAWLTLTDVVPFAYRDLKAEIETEKIYREALIAYKRYLGRWDQPWEVVAIPELKRIHVSGPIGWSSAKALEDVIKKNPDIKLLELDSPGGLIHERELIIQVVQKYHLDTLVLNSCVSACTAAFLAGERRFVTQDSEFGFHKSSGTKNLKPEQWTIPEFMNVIFYRGKGVSPGFMLTALTTPFETIWRPDALAVKQSGFATDWWFNRPIEYR